MLCAELSCRAWLAAAAAIEDVRPSQFIVLPAAEYLVASAAAEDRRVLL